MTLQTTMGQNYKAIKVSLSDNGACWIKFNRPKKYNAFNFLMYEELIQAAKEAELNPRCKILVLTGSGPYYTSGADQTNFGDPEAVDKPFMFRDFVDLLIDIKKPIIALVNGHAVGMGVTTLGLCDLVIASDQATFICPFSRLGLNPEGCSSYIFPKIMGHSLASEMLLFNKKASAEEMKAAGLVSVVVPHHQFYRMAEDYVNQCCDAGHRVLVEGKALMKPDSLKQKLHEVNHQECQVLFDLITTPEAAEAVLKFLSRRNKSKL